eukprot:c26934_g1_i1.p1 GENE.c26934_g1_i1~~c26934_g1_i1.p1  ORF type:complete len:215 (+),score=42.57 c26934_g1_i1:36-647(+)
MESVVFGSALPPSIQGGLPLLQRSNIEQSSLCLRFVSHYVKGRAFGRAEFLTLLEKTGLDEVSGTALVMALLSLLRLSVKRKFKQDVLLKEWAQAGVPDEFSKVLLPEVVACRAILEAGESSHKLSLPSIDLLLWRVDVGISTSALSRSLKPSIPVQLSLSDGRVRSFEMSIEQFHDLRFNVARMLKDMFDLEAHSIVFKIDD